ncbi:MAG: M23 family metallopeptidase [Lachnospiraceae bacterium]|nr:M23 family metallopeptidase [Lachnospiraceae bacterium]
MRRNNNRKNNAKRERIIMFASSAFVLAALTMTGIYMKSRNVESQDDGYTIDFTALEDSTDDKYEEIAQNTEVNQENAPDGLEDDLDYTPMEVGSGLVEIPGLTDGNVEEETELPQIEPQADPVSEAETILEEKPEVIAEAPQEEEPEEEPQPEPQPEQAAAQDVIVARELHFSEENGLLKPVNGTAVIPYSMDGSTYFATLDLYKYNPALMIGTEEGSAVTACAEGKVVNIFENEEIGHAVTMDLGNGYQLTYGQLKDINVTLDSYVNPGDVFASVAAPTKYFCREGSNLYLMLTKDGAYINPESLF